MRGRHVTTAVTLLVLLAVLAVAAWFGYKSLLAPIGEGDKASSCDKTAIRRGQQVTTRQVQVSVFNAGDRSGLAGRTMTRLAHRGFKKGAVGNAPSGTKVKHVQVWTTQKKDVAARLVARQFGGGTRVRLVDTNLGPGVDVVIGNHPGQLVKASKATRRIVVQQRRASACLPPARHT